MTRPCGTSKKPALPKKVKPKPAETRPAAIYMHAQPALKQWKARPLQGREARLGFVATDDRGCNSHGLFPDTPLIVQPCEEFLGVGIYQLFCDGRLEVRFCRQVDTNLIEITIDGPRASGGGPCLIPIDEFEDQVCGLVLAQIQGVNDEWTASLFAQRAKFYS